MVNYLKKLEFIEELLWLSDEPHAFENDIPTSELVDDKIELYSTSDG